MRFLSTSISKEQAGDSGMAAVLILMIVGLIVKDETFFMIATGALLMNMIFPMFFYPFAIFWYGLAHLMGSVVSRVLLTVIYIFIVLPVALFRQLTGKDTLKLKDFKKGDKSVLRHRDQVYKSSDMEKPF